MRLTCRILFSAPSPQRLGLWWPTLTPSAKSVSPVSSTTTLLDNASGAAVLPDAVVEAWLTWIVRQRPESAERTCRDGQVGPSLSEVLSCIPVELKANSDAAGIALMSDAAVSNTSTATTSTAAITVGALCTAMSGSTCIPDTPLETVLTHLCTCTPLFLQLSATPAHVALLAAYCREVVVAMQRQQHQLQSAAGAGLLSPYLQRVLGGVRVSWQPWVTAPQRALLTTENPSAAATALLNESLRCGTSTESSCTSIKQTAGFSAALQRAQTLLETELERSWRILLDNVPTHYVSAKLVRANLQRTYGSDGEALLCSWTKCAASKAFTSLEERVTKAARDTSASRDVRTSEEALDPQCHHRPFPPNNANVVYLEVSADGKAVRAPAKEACLQAGCPARLVYRDGSATEALLRSRFSLLQNTHCGPALMHYATALLASVVPTTFTDLRSVRQLFTAHKSGLRSTCDQQQQQQLQTFLESCSTTSSAASSVHAVCADFFPCVEVLLDHPDLAFALQLRDNTHSLVLASLPHSSSLLTGDREASASTNSLEVRLHPAFAHAHRGVADVVLRTLGRDEREAVERDDTKVTLCHGSCSSEFGEELFLAMSTCQAQLHFLHQVGDAVSPSLLAGLQCSTNAEMTGQRDSLRAEDAAEGVAARRADAVVYVSCTHRSSEGEAEKLAVPAEDQMIFAVASVPHQVHVVVVTQACLKVLYAELSIAASCAGASTAVQSVPEVSGEDARRALRGLARLLCDTAVIKVIPSRHSLSLTCAHQRNLMTRFLSTVPDAVLMSVGTLLQVACYTGQPIGDALLQNKTQNADRLLAALTNYQGNVRVEVATEQIKMCESEVQSRGEAAETVSEAANAAVAASLMVRGFRLEANREDLPKHDASNGRCNPKAHADLRWTEALQRWSLSPQSMYDDNVALRLRRYTTWLRGAIKANTRESRDLPSLVGDTGVSFEAAREALRQLVVLYGPEPYPLMKVFNNATASSLGVAHTKNQVINASQTSQDTHDASVAVDAAELLAMCDPTIDATSFSSSSSSSEESEDTTSMDNLLYDALLHDAAVVKHGRDNSLCADSAPAHGETGFGDAGQQGGRASAFAFPATKENTSASPVVAATTAAAPVHDASVNGATDEHDTLQYYLSAVLGEEASHLPHAPATTSAPHSIDSPRSENSPSSPASYASHGVTTDLPPELPRIPRGFLYGPRQTPRAAREDSAVVFNAPVLPPPPPPLPPQRLEVPPQPPTWPPQISQMRSARHRPTGNSDNLRRNGLFCAPPVQPSAQAASSVARFDPFAPWKTGDHNDSSISSSDDATFVSDTHRAKDLSTAALSTERSMSSASPRCLSAPPAPPSTPSAAKSTSAVAAVMPPITPTDNLSEITKDFLGKVSDAERLRLASLIVDILRCSNSGSPPMPPRQ